MALPPDPIYTFRGEMSSIHCLLIRMVGEKEYLFVGTNSGCVHVWDVQNLRQLKKLHVSSGACLSICYNEKRYFTQEKGGDVTVWDEQDSLEWSKCAIIPLDYIGFCRLITFNNLLLLPHMESELKIVSSNHPFSVIRTLNYQGEKKLGQIMAARCLGERILVLFENGDIIMWHNSGQMVSQNSVSVDCPMNFDVCCNTSEGVIGSSGLTITKFSVKEHCIECTGSATITNPGVSSVAISECGKLCVAGCWDGRIRYFSMKTLKPLAVLCHHEESIESVIFSSFPIKFSNTKVLIAASKDTRISLWNLYMK